MDSFDPEFVRVTTRVFAIGLTLISIGTLALYFAFRRFMRRDGNQADGQSFVILLGAAGLILICCIALLRWSVVR